MSKRDDDRDNHYNKGSSRSRDRDHYRKRREEDDSKYKSKQDVSRERSRSREKDHKQRTALETTYSKTETSPARVVPIELEDRKVREMSISPQREEDEGEIPPPPPPPRISKVSMGFNRPQPTVAPTIKMNLGGFKSQPLPKKTPIASVFSADDDDEPEEMPAEARMRMRNIGRETPTSAGPNSFGKTKQGFCDSKKIFEKNLKAAMDDVSHQKSPVSKLPNTIYKL